MCSMREFNIAKGCYYTRFTCVFVSVRSLFFTLCSFKCRKVCRFGVHIIQLKVSAVLFDAYMSSGKQYTHLFADTIKIALFMCIKFQAYRESIRILISGEKGCSEYVHSAALLEEKNTQICKWNNTNIRNFMEFSSFYWKLKFFVTIKIHLKFQIEFGKNRSVSKNAYFVFNI